MRNQSTSFKKNSRNKRSDSLSLPAKRKRIEKEAIITYEVKDNELEYLTAHSRGWLSSFSSTSISIFLSTLVALILYGESNRYVEWILVASLVASIIFGVKDITSKNELKELISKIKKRK